MKSLKTGLGSLFAVLALALALPLTAQADQPGKHPAYLHALTDLRNARANLEKRPGDRQVQWDEKVAISEIDAAINEIKKASIDDGKDLKDHPPVDFTKDYWGRLHEASRALHAAHGDVKQEEDNDYTRGLQHRAIVHIDGATNFVDQGIANAK
jgi:hypothetical protein